MATNSNQSFDEHRWIIQIRLTLDQDHLEAEENDHPVTIFNVPKILMVSALDYYVPQQIAIGPYHHWRSELYEMERYKLVSAKRFQKQSQCLKFQNVVDQLTMLEPKIRACYYKYLDINGETLAWMMAMDACFLLDFLRIYAAKGGGKLARVSSRMCHLVDIAGRKSAHNAILRDIVMLENQIPLFLLRKMLELEFSSLEVADNALMSILEGFCKELLPFMIMEGLPKIEVTNCAHLLDFLYIMIVPKLEGLSEISEIDEDCEAKEDDQDNKFCYMVLRIKRMLLSKPVQFMLKLPWTIISNLPVVRQIKAPIEYLCFSEEKETQKQANENLYGHEKPPMVEEITIPSVIELTRAGVQFIPTNEGIFSVNFDEKNATFFLPRISIDLNTEVILRNLVAYEACNASGPLIFTRYTELMNGIIDTEDDAKILREKGIVLNHLKSDEDVANLWNGMSKSVRLTRVQFLDKVIEDVNKYYNGKWNIKIGKFLKFHVFESWRFLTLIAVLVILLLMMLQAFCSIYRCARVSHIRKA